MPRAVRCRVQSTAVAVSSLLEPPQYSLISKAKSHSLAARRGQRLQARRWHAS